LLAASDAVVAMGTAANVAASTTFTVPGGPFTLTQIGYDAFIQVQANATSSFPYVAVTFTWLDSVSSQIVAQERWNLNGATAAQFQEYLASGPTKGNQLTITCQNFDVTHAMQFQIVMVENSRVRIRDDIRQLTYNAVPSLTNGNSDPPAQFLLQSAPSINAGVTQARTIPVYSGKVKILATGTLPYLVQVAAASGSISTASVTGTPFWSQAVTAAGGGTVDAEVALPRCSCNVLMTNNGGAAQNIGVEITCIEQPA